MFFRTAFLSWPSAIFLAAIALSGCESTESSNDSLNQIRSQIDSYLRQSEPLPDQAFIEGGPLTVVADRISHLDANFDRSDTRNYYVYPCKDATGSCLYYTGLNGQPIPGSDPVHRLNFRNSERYGTYFQFNQCEIISGLTKSCAPDDGEVVLTANGAGYSGSTTSTSLVTWHQDQAGARRAAAIREMMLPRLLNGRITRAQVRASNAQALNTANAILSGINSGLKVNDATSNQSNAAGSCPVKPAGMSNTAYAAQLTPKLAHCRPSTCGPDRDCSNNPSSRSIQ